MIFDFLLLLLWFIMLQFIAGLIHVPFNRWLANKFGKDFDPKTNSFVKRTKKK